MIFAHQSEEIDLVKNPSIAKLIHQLHELKLKKSQVIQAIKDPKALISALLELDSFIEMDDVKTAIIQQIQRIIINQARRAAGTLTHSKSDNHLLHTVIYGPPGVGKTKLGLILAKLWMALGIIKSPTTTKSNTAADKFAVKEAIYLSRIVELKNTVNTYQNRLKRIYDVAIREKDTINHLRGRIIRLRPTYNTELGGDREWEDIFRESRQVRYAFDDIVKDATPENKEFEDVEMTEPVKSSDTTSANNASSKTTDSKTVDANSDIPITTVSRVDLVGEYQGHSATKTLALLKANLGKVLFIDEAYSLINGDGDNFGLEVLTELNRFMSEHSDEIIIILAGYKDLMQKTIFTAQPGLRRRCNLVIEIKNYSAKALSGIFTKQLHGDGWELDPSIDLEPIFKNNMDKFPSYGGDTEKLTYYVGLAYSDNKFEEAYTCIKDDCTLQLDNIITEKVLMKALNMLTSNDAQKIEVNDTHLSMFS